MSYKYSLMAILICFTAASSWGQTAAPLRQHEFRSIGTITAQTKDGVNVVCRISIIYEGKSGALAELIINSFEIRDRIQQLIGAKTTREIKRDNLAKEILQNIKNLFTYCKPVRIVFKELTVQDK